MASDEKSAIQLNKPIDGPTSFIFAADVLDPLNEAEDWVEAARERVSVTPTDTHSKHLSDAIVAGDGIVKSGTDVLTFTGEIGRALIDDSVLGSAAASITISSIASTWDEWLLVAWLRGDTAATSVNLTARLANDITATNYYSQRIDAAATTVSASEAYESAANLLTGSVPIPAASSPTGAWGLLKMYFNGVNTTSLGVTAGWRVMSPLAQSTGNIRWLAGTGWYSQLSVVSRIDLLPSSGNFTVGSRTKLYGLKRL